MTTDEKQDRGSYVVTDVRAAIHYAGADGKTRQVKTGETASDIPAKSVGWMLDRGWIEKGGKTISIPAKVKAKPAEEVDA